MSSLLEYTQAQGYPSFTSAFERSESGPASYTLMLHLHLNAPVRAGLEIIRRAAAACSTPQREILALFADYDWRPQIVGATSFLLVPDLVTDEALAALWEAFDSGSWVSPQLAATALLCDPQFEKQARSRIETGCPIKRDRLEALDWPTRHSAAGPISFNGHSSKALAALVAVCRELPEAAQSHEWLNRALTYATTQSKLTTDRDGGDRIATHWLANARQVGGQSRR